MKNTKEWGIALFGLPISIWAFILLSILFVLIPTVDYLRTLMEDVKRR